MKQLTQTHKAILDAFPLAPDEAGVPIPVAQVLLGGRGRASIYRDINAGKLEAFHIGKSTRLRVGSCRRVLKGDQ